MELIFCESMGTYIEGEYFDLFNKNGEDRSFRKGSPFKIFKQLGHDVKGLAKRPKCDIQAGEYEKLQPWLLDMARSAKDMDRINYLKADARVGKQQLQTLAKNLKDVKNGTPNRYISVSYIEKCIEKGLTEKKINDHIKFLDGEYKKALNERAKEIRQQAKNESTIFNNIEFI